MFQCQKVTPIIICTVITQLSKDEKNYILELICKNILLWQTNQAQHLMRDLGFFKYPALLMNHPVWMDTNRVQTIFSMLLGSDNFIQIIICPIFLLQYIKNHNDKKEIWTILNAQAFGQSSCKILILLFWLKYKKNHHLLHKGNSFIRCWAWFLSSCAWFVGKKLTIFTYEI